MMLEGKRLLLTGVITKRSIPYLLSALICHAA